MKSALRVSPLWAIGLAIGLVVVLAARVQGSPPDRASSAIAGDVTTLMGDRHLDAIAALIAEYVHGLLEWIELHRLLDYGCKTVDALTEVNGVPVHIDLQLIA